MSEANDQPVVEEELVSTPAGVEAEADAPEGDETPELDDDGQPIEAATEDDETEEIEHDGAKHRIPKALKPLLMFQQDYTRKTQELATQRNGLESERQAFVQQTEAQATTLEERAGLLAIEAQLQQYQAINWADYRAQHGSDAAQDARDHWQQLREAKSTLQETITSKETEHRLSREQTIANARQEAMQAVAREVPGWTPETANTLERWAGEQLGFTAAELVDSLVTQDGKPDTRALKVLARLHAAEAKLAKLEAKETKAKVAERQAAVEPARTVRANAGAFKPGLNDELPIEEWTRRRNAEAAKAQAHNPHRR